MTELEKKQQEIEAKLAKIEAIETANTELKSQVEGYKTQLEELKADKEADEKKFTALDEKLTDLEKEMKDSKENDNKEVKTIGDAFDELSKKDEFKDLAKQMLDTKNVKVNKTFEIKANVLSSALTGNRQRSIIEAGVDKPEYRMPFMRDIVPNVPTSSPVIYWTERVTHTDGTGGVAEGDAAGTSSSTWEEKSRQVVTRGVNYKFSIKSMNDIPQLIEDLRQDVVQEMELDIDDQILSGNGVGQNFFGIDADSTEFSVTAVNKAGKVVNPNLADLIKCMALQIQIKHLRPSHALVSPLDFADLELEKDNDGQYVLPPFKTADGTLVSGVRIVQNTAIAQNTCKVIDSSRIRFYVNQDMQLQIWDQNEDDAVKRFKTATLWFDGQVRVRENDKLGIIKVDDIENALGLLRKV